MLEPEPVHRTRLQQGIALAVSEKGYADTTIADIVRYARVSKRTFYEHYVDKEACFLAAYAAMSDALLAQVAAASASVAPGEKQIEAATRAYFSALDAQRQTARAFLSEIHAAGPPALALRRKIHLKFAALLRSTVERARREATTPVRLLSPEMAIAIVGGINELVLSSLEQDRRSDLAPLNKTAVALIRAVVLPGSA